MKSKTAAYANWGSPTTTLWMVCLFVFHVPPYLHLLKECLFTLEIHVNINHEYYFYIICRCDFIFLTCRLLLVIIQICQLTAGVKLMEAPDVKISITTINDHLNTIITKDLLRTLNDNLLEIVFFQRQNSIRLTNLKYLVVNFIDFSAYRQSLVLHKAKGPLWWPHLNVWELKFGRSIPDLLADLPLVLTSSGQEWQLADLHQICWQIYPPGTDI